MKIRKKTMPTELGLCTTQFEFFIQIVLKYQNFIKIIKHEKNLFFQNSMKNFKLPIFFRTIFYFLTFFFFFSRDKQALFIKTRQ